jgi:hypothetical protein
MDQTPQPVTLPRSSLSRQRSRPPPLTHPTTQAAGNLGSSVLFPQVLKILQAGRRVRDLAPCAKHGHVPVCGQESKPADRRVASLPGVLERDGNGSTTALSSLGLG